MLSRRSILAGGTALGAASQAVGQGPKNIVISSANGLTCCEVAMSRLQRGHDTLEAVVAGVNVNELDPEDNSVGYGGLPNEEGVVELDASVMHGPTRRAGSVGAIRNIKTPSNIAKLVMEQTTHIMLVGDNALRFAKAHGYKEEDLLTEKSRLAWLVWKRGLRGTGGGNNWVGSSNKPGAHLKSLFPQVDEQLLAWAESKAMYPPTGTINCLALNSKGEMSGTTTTSGLAWKIPGRVGDSPIIGAGLYVDQDIGAAGSTGLGEENIRICGAHTIVENMRHGMLPKEACIDALKRVSRNYNHDLEKLKQFDLNFYALRKDGVYGGAGLWSGKRESAGFTSPKFAVNDGGKSRLEDCVYLYERR